MLKKIFINFIGLSIIGFSIFLTLALITYSSYDPSFNRALEVNKISNWSGYAGAYIAGPLIQGFRMTLLLPLIFLYMMGFKLIFRRSFNLLLIRISILIISIPALAFCLAYIGKLLHFKYELGGVMGSFLLAETSTKYYNAIFTTALVTSIIGFIISFNINFKDLTWFVKKIIKISMLITISLWRLNKLIYSTFNKRNLNVLTEESQDESIIEFKESPPIKNKTIKPTLLDSPNLIPKKVIASSNLFNLPSSNLLKGLEKSKKSEPTEHMLSASSALLQKVLDDFGIMGEITRIHPGPVVTLYEFEPIAGTKSSRVIGLSDDIARSMTAISARIAVIPGKSSLGIELPNATREMVGLKELIDSSLYVNSNEKLPLVLGKNIGGEPIIADLAKMPHLLVAGTTGSGKSVAINTMILSLLYKHPPSECRFIMIDPKMLELSIYDGIPHLLASVVTEPKKAISALKWVVKEMENRYRLMSLAGVRNLDSYNALIASAIKSGQKLQKQIQIGFDTATGQPKYETIDIEENHLPYIVVIVDEMADLMIVAGKEIESSIQRLAQMARAAGIHIIMATQRPSVDVITGVIKANFPTRISFQVTSKIDSRTILGEQGADQLLGMGDMLFMRGGGRIERVHGPFVSDKEVEVITNFLKAQEAPKYIESITISEEEANFNESNESSGDDLYDQALALVIQDRKASTSYIQRCLRIGYNRAANIIDRMEKERVVSAPNHVGKRDILVGEN